MDVALNRKKCTAIACERTLLIKIDKRMTQGLFTEGSGNLDARKAFLRGIPLFKTIDEFMLLSLANSVRISSFCYGEYIVREGDQPKGLHIITGGQAVVASRKVSMRSTLPHQFSRFKTN